MLHYALSMVDRISLNRFKDKKFPPPIKDVAKTTAALTLLLSTVACSSGDFILENLEINKYCCVVPAFFFVMYLLLLAGGGGGGGGGGSGGGPGPESTGGPGQG